ncbi:GNAT family N-acetyltransferase [Embleya sp. AB8]|uniref:GNAT family N-acetyltransferase n=1 Tax=Embleya sp. AB8 TaxID=3156304 RepID=UPI003C70C96B
MDVVTPGAPALVLRPWRLADADAVVEAYRDPEVRRLTDAPPDDRAAAQEWVRAQWRGWAAGDRFGFAVVEDGRVVGTVVVKDVAAGAGIAEVGYWTVADARGRGVAARALEALTAWAFATFGDEGLAALRLLHQVDNVASCRVAEKGGYRFDRILPPWPPTYPLDGHLHLRRGQASRMA